MLENLDAQARIRPCKIRSILEMLDDADQKILRGALADRNKWTHHALWVALKETGLSLGYGSLFRHREKLCSCEVSDA